MSETIKIGAVIKFGKYDWRVLEVQDGRALILSENNIRSCYYNGQYADVTWETCVPRKILNGEFLEKFKEQQSRIIKTRIINNNNLWYGTPGGRDTDDKIFLLCLEEADKYFGNSGDYLNKRGNFSPDNNVGGISNNYDSNRKGKSGFFGENSWWLRSPGHSNSYAAIVNRGGSILVSGIKVFVYENSYAVCGVRPALWLSL
jgi:hypothetical protein